MTISKERMEELENQASLADGKVEIGHDAMYIETAELRALLRLARLAEVRGEALAIESLRAERDRLREALKQMLPRYIELFEAAGLGNQDDSVAVNIARTALGGEAGKQ